MLDWFCSRFKSAGTESVLDVGCGIGRHSETFSDFDHYLGIDIVRDFLIRASFNSKLPYTICNAAHLETHFVPLSFDAVLWYDSIEHLDKNRALCSLAYSLKIARKCVGVFTPLGFFEQTDNVWGGDAGDAQVHKSGWQVSDFTKLGFEEVEVIGTSRRGKGMVKLILAMWRRK